MKKFKMARRPEPLSKKILEAALWVAVLVVLLNLYFGVLAPTLGDMLR